MSRSREMIVVGRMAVGISCVVVGVAAGCSSPAPANVPRAPASVSAVAVRPAMSAIQEQSIPGVGATRANWDASHALNALSDTGSDYGDDPSLPPYVTNNGAVYKEVKDLGTDRIQTYYLAMHTVDAQGVLRQLRHELPPDATIAWDLPRDQCYRVAFNSPTLQVAGGYMVEAELQYIQQDGTPATGPDRFNIASFWLDEAGSPPDPDKDC